MTKVLSHATGFVCILRTRRQIIQINVEVAGNEKIEPAIAVVITPGRAGAPALARYTELLGHVCKRAVTVIVIEPRNSEVANEDVGPAIVIVIADRHAHSPTLVGDTGFISHIFELPIAEIMIKRGAWRLFFSLKGRNCRTVEKIDIRQTIAVVIKNCHAARGHFKNVVFGRRSGAMFEIRHGRLISCVLENHRRFRINDVHSSP